MRIKFLSLAVVLSGAMQLASAQVDEHDVRTMLSALADDSMQGRLTATPGARRAARYIARQMAAFRLAPAGDSGFFMRVPLVIGPDGPRLPDSTTDTVSHRPAQDVNVMGWLRGTDPALKGEVVLIDAHFDHLGIGRPVNGDSIYNGADDDASGVVTVLLVARALAAGTPPKRTILFVATTGEEEGLLGTNWLIAHFPVPLDSVKANLETEMIGRPDPKLGGAGRAWLTGYERTTMGPAFKAAGLAILPDPHPDQHFFERSDNIAYALLGIPAQTLSSYGLHTDYHAPSDDLAHVDVAHMTAVINAAIKAVRLLANGPAIEWAPGGRPTAP
jgi:hypothetical protein